MATFIDFSMMDNKDFIKYRYKKNDTLTETIHLTENIKE